MPSIRTAAPAAAPSSAEGRLSTSLEAAAGNGATPRKALPERHGQNPWLGVRRLLLPALLLLIVLMPACAARDPRASRRASSVFSEDTAALIRLGCYECLERAFRAAHAQGAREQAFEAAGLLVLRSKELGMPFDQWLDRAREHAGLDSFSILYLEILQAIPPDPLSGDRAALEDFEGRRQARASLTAWRDALARGPGSELFHAYLDVALVCAFGRLTGTEQSFSGPLDPVAEAPLYQYRVGICDNSHEARLAAVRAAHPDFIDADYALGRYAIEDPVDPDFEEGLRRLQSAVRAFPASPAIATSIGNVHRTWEEWAPALEAYDAAVALAPDHPDALLGRTISLSRLMRPEEAIATATRLIELGQWRIGEAHYWRAWNYLLLGEYESARRDADRARTLMANSAVYVLSGAIEWRLRRLENAEREFERALAMNLGECEAALDLGVVRDELGRQPEALAAFRQARQCYELSMAVRREAIAKIWSGPGADTAKARAAAAHERVLEDMQARYADALQAIAVLEEALPADSSTRP